MAPRSVVTHDSGVYDANGVVLDLLVDPLTSDLDAGTNKITNLTDGVAASDAATVGQLAGGGTPTGAAGGSLDGTYPNPGIAASVAGAGLAETTNVLSVNVDGSTLEINSDTLRVKADGITANEIAANAVGSSELASTAVTPTTYGDATHVGQFTVDADGRLTAASSVSITGTGGMTPPTGTGFVHVTSGVEDGAAQLVTEADITTADNTTDNVTSSKHGFAPKSPADATKFLHGDTIPGYAQVKDSDLSTSDITTNNVSNSKHGFAPKNPNDATKYLDGTGAYSTPAGAGAGSSALIYRYTVAGSDKASIDTGVDTPDAGSNSWTNGDMLEVFFYGRSDEAVVRSTVNVTVNNDTGSVYDLTFIEVLGTTSSFGNTRTAAQWSWNAPGANAATNNFGGFEFRIPNFMGTIGDKQGMYSMGFADVTSSSCITDVGNIRYRPTTPVAVSRIKIIPNTAGKKFKVGSQLLVYKRLAS